MSTIIFDFDCTLTKKDTTRPLAAHFTRTFKGYHRLVCFYVGLLAYRLGLIEDETLKEFFLRLFLRGRSENQIRRAVDTFVEQHVEGLLNRWAFSKLMHYQNAGDQVFIASANFDFLLEPLVAKWKIEGAICTVTERNDGYFTGKIIDKSCKGIHKYQRLESFFGRDELRRAVAYADSDDLLLGDLVGEFHVVPADISCTYLHHRLKKL